MTSRSWQYILCHWDACSNHSVISDFCCKEMYCYIILEVWGGFKCTGSRIDWCTGNWWFWFKYDLGQKYNAPQVPPDWGSNSYMISSWWVTENHTWLSVLHTDNQQNHCVCYLHHPYCWGMRFQTAGSLKTSTDNASILWCFAHYLRTGE